MDRLYALVSAEDVGALLAVVEATRSSPDLDLRAQAEVACRGFARLLAASHAGKALSSDVSSLVTDLFGGSDPRRAAEAARGALAVYGVACGIGPGSDLVRKLHLQPNPDHAK